MLSKEPVISYRMGNLRNGLGCSLKWERRLKGIVSKHGKNDAEKVDFYWAKSLVLNYDPGVEIRSILCNSTSSVRNYFISYSPLLFKEKGQMVFLF